MACLAPTFRAEAPIDCPQGRAELLLILDVQSYLRNHPSRTESAWETAAWDRFYDTYHPHILKLCRKYRPRQEPEDLAQEIWAKLTQRLPEFRFNETYPTIAGWLAGFVRRELRGWPPRREDPRIKALSPELALALISHGLSPAEEHEQVRLVRVVREVIQQLRGRASILEYGVFELRWLERLQIRAVAQRLGESSRTIQNALYRADRKFRELMERHSEFSTLVETAGPSHGRPRGVSEGRCS